MPRLYRLSAATESVDRLGSPPRAPSRALIGRYEWDLPEAEFRAIPKLRRWLQSEGVGDVEERGMQLADREHEASASLLRLDPQSSVTASTVHIVEEHGCPGCGFTVRSLVDEPHLVLTSTPDRPVAYVSEAQSIIASTEVVRDLGAKDLVSGLCFAPATTPDDRSFVLVWSDRPVGMPAAPYGDDGTVCRVCGRSVVRRAGRTYPARPRFGFYECYHRPSEEGQWLYNDIDGPLRPMVTAAVRDSLWAHDPDLAFTPLAWYPEGREEAFLDERFH